MTGVPADLYDRVFELATEMTDASEAEDEAAYEGAFGALRALFEEHRKAGRVHPFLTETLADYTDEPQRAIELYRLALTDSQAFPDEHTYTKHLSLAERLMESGLVDEARKHLELGRKQAWSAGDSDWIKSADLLAQTLVA